LLHIEDFGELVVSTMPEVNMTLKATLGLERSRAEPTLVFDPVQVTDFDVIGYRLALLALLGTDGALEQPGVLIQFDELPHFLFELGRGQV